MTDLSDWLAERVDSGELTETTLDEYQQRARRFEDFRDGGGVPAADTIIRFMEHRVAEGVSRGTLELDKAAIRWVAKFYGGSPEYPRVEEWLDTEGPDSEIDRDCFTDEELFQVVEAAADRGTRDAAIFGLLADTGLRVGELVALDVGDLLGKHTHASQYTEVPAKLQLSTAPEVDGNETNPDPTEGEV